MEKTHCSVHYRTLPRCTVQFKVRQEHAAFVELLDGYAQVKQDGTVNNLPRRERYQLQPLYSFLFSNEGCSFKVYGRHEITWSEGEGAEKGREMFQLLRVDSNLQFYIGKAFQLLVFHHDERKRITLEIIHGYPRILGSVFPTAHRGQTHYLPPYSHILIMNDKPESYPYCVIATNEPTELCDFFISPYEAEVWAVVKNIQKMFHYKGLCALSGKVSSPKMLVLGNRNVTKISFCHFILDKALETGRIPVYVDLNVRENSNGIPGSVRIIPIRSRRVLNEGRCHVSKLFLGDENMLSFGYLDPESNIKFYYHLLKSLRVLSNKIDLKYRGKKAGTVIDMCDSLSNNLKAIRWIIETFEVSIIVVVGDKDLYQLVETLQHTGLQKFIPHQENIEPLNYNLRNDSLRDYFFQNRNIFSIKFSDIAIYEIISEGAAVSVESNTIITPVEVQAVPITCGKHLENHVLGVYPFLIIRHLPVTRVKYFVFIMAVDMENEILTVLSPVANSPSGSILVKGGIKCEMQNEA